MYLFCVAFYAQLLIHLLLLNIIFGKKKKSNINTPSYSML